MRKIRGIYLEFYAFLVQVINMKENVSNNIQSLKEMLNDNNFLEDIKEFPIRSIREWIENQFFDEEDQKERFAFPVTPDY